MGEPQTPKRKIDPTVITSPGGLLAAGHALTDRQAEALASDLFAKVEAQHQDEDSESSEQDLE